MPVTDPAVRIGGSPAVPRGDTASPGHRASFARHVVLFTSGKGGVGKTLVAVNVANALAQRGLRVGLLDADVHGPSVPRMLQLAGERVRWNDADRMIPAENFGLRVMSVGLTTPEADTPLGWRSAVATAALVQMLDDVEWGPLDVLAIDLPPGTGDVALSLSQSAYVAGAIVVTSPQQVAVADTRRAVAMYQKLNIPVLGLIENMSYFACPSCRHESDIFGRGGGERLAGELQLPFLGSIPISEPVRQGGDTGVPIMLSDPDSPAAEAFVKAAERTAAQVSIQSFRTPVIPLTPVN